MAQTEEIRLRHMMAPHRRLHGIHHGPPVSRPPHTISDVGVIGGGHVPMPGEV
jgi:hypothetical protein